MNALTAALWKLVCVRELFRLAALEAMVLNTPLARSRVQLAPLVPCCWQKLDLDGGWEEQSAAHSYREQSSCQKRGGWAATACLIESDLD